MAERVQKLLSQWGIASRRQAEQLIREGRVRLNGETVELGQTADPSSDRLEVDGQLIEPRQRPQPLYLLLHKPAGVVTTCQDPQRRPTVLALLPHHLSNCTGLHPVGRLDTASTGALLLTNDGELTFQLTHPKHAVSKTYHVWVEGNPSKATLQKWREGVVLSGRLTQPAQVTILAQRDQPTPRTHLEIVLWEGRNRQIRRVAEQLGHPVLQLHRVAIGAIALGGLPVGHHRFLENHELDALSRLIRSNPSPLPHHRIRKGSSS